MTVKKCSKCHKNTPAKGRKMCEPCLEYQRNWKAAHREECREAWARFYAMHREELLEHKSRWKAANPDKNWLWNHRWSARHRGLADPLPNAELLALYWLPCHYCGKRPAKSVDRKNSSRGYLRDNVVPCCLNCNSKKRTKPYEVFIKQLKAA